MFNVKATLTPDHQRYEGVRPLQIFAMRVGYVLVVVTVGNIAWSRILQREGGWDPLTAAALSMWAGSSVLSVFGLINPLKWLPIVLFEITYKSIWLVIVAYPLWSTDQLAGSPAEGMTYAFLWVVVPVVAMPWGYVLRTYLLPSRIAHKGI
jgi:hypothetical protein